VAAPADGKFGGAGSVGCCPWALLRLTEELEAESAVA